MFFQFKAFLWFFLSKGIRIAKKRTLDLAIMEVDLKIEHTKRIKGEYQTLFKPHRKISLPQIWKVNRKLHSTIYADTKSSVQA